MLTFAAGIRNLWRDKAAREYCDIVEPLFKLKKWI